MESKRMLCINYEYPPIGGGGGMVCKGLAEALTQRGYEIDIVTSGTPGLPPFERFNGIRIHRTRCIRRYRHYVTFPEMLTLILPMYQKALQLVRKTRYDLNHTHFILPSGLVSYLLMKKTGLPYIITCHGSDVPGYNPDRFSRLHKLLKPFWTRIIQASHGLSTPSHFLRELIQENIDYPVDVIPNGYDLPECRIQKKKNRILVVTRMFKRKGVQFFIEAMKRIDTDWEICIAGDGPYLNTLKEMAKDYPAIRFLGFVRGTELANLYNSSKIFVFPSLQENFPMVLLEAMSCGCAVITSDASGCMEVVGDAGILTRCGDVQDLLKAIEYLLHNENEIDRRACRALGRAKEFTWHNIACHFDEMSRRCITLPAN